MFRDNYLGSVLNAEIIARVSASTYSRRQNNGGGLNQIGVSRNANCPVGRSTRYPLALLIRTFVARIMRSIV